MNTLHANAMKTQARNKLLEGICQCAEELEWAFDLRAGALAEEADLELDEAGCALEDLEAEAE